MAARETPPPPFAVDIGTSFIIAEAVSFFFCPSGVPAWGGCRASFTGRIKDPREKGCCWWVATGWPPAQAQLRGDDLFSFLPTNKTGTKANGNYQLFRWALPFSDDGVQYL